MTTIRWVDKILKFLFFTSLNLHTTKILQSYLAESISSIIDTYLAITSVL